MSRCAECGRTEWASDHPADAPVDQCPCGVTCLVEDVNEDEEPKCITCGCEVDDLQLFCFKCTVARRKIPGIPAKVQWRCQGCRMCQDTYCAFNSTEFGDDDFDYVKMAILENQRNRGLSPVQREAMDAWWNDEAEAPIDVIKLLNHEGVCQ